MNLNEFGEWLENHTADWRRPEPLDGYTDSELPQFPPIYRDFLDRFGPIVVFTTQSFMDVGRMAKYIQFMRGLVGLPENVAHLVPFFNMGYGSIALCFDGDTIVDFDPMNGTTFVAASFEEFLGRHIGSGGEQFWLEDG